MNTKNRVVKLRPDKFLGDEYFRHLFIGHEKNEKSGQEHEYRDVEYFPEGIFKSEDDSGEKIFFIPIILVHDISQTEVAGNGCQEKKPLPVPIFMLDLKRARIEEIQKIAKAKDMKISDKYFRKPILAMCYGERLDKGLEIDEETLEIIEIKTTFKKKTRKSPYGSSKFNHMH